MPGSFSKPYGVEERAEPIAVVGMSCRFPSANNLSEFWELLENGMDAIRKAPGFRWKIDQYPYLKPGLDKVEAGFLSVPIDEFDAKFFEVSPKEAMSMDPQHRLLMEVVWESFEDAAINPQKVRGARGGVFLGTWLNQYKDILQLDQDEANANFYRNYKGTCVGVGAARISQLLGWTGPCNGTESDCSAGLTSVSMACKSLQNGDCNIALACGVNILVLPFLVENLPAVLSPDYRCKTFDESANGFARGEGAGAVVLKRYSDAVKDGDRILGLIRGTATSQEGMNSSMGTPTVASQMEAVQKALQSGGVDPAQVSYVEAHGTGTPVGDVVEMEGISRVYCDGVKRKEKLIIGSVKTNLGHTESCSGLAGLIKVLLAMKNKVIPPHINFKNLNPKINLEEMNAKLPLEPLPWPRSSPEQPRIAGISSFGLAGKNCHVVVEEPPENVKELNTGNTERPLHILKVTAKTEPALDTLLDQYTDLFEKHSKSEKLNFADFACTANVGKADFNCRAVLLAEDFESAVKSLKNGSFERSQVTQAAPKVCFLFTGQGSQYQGMAQELYETSPVFKSHFDFCNDFLQSNFNFSVRETLFGKDGQEVNRTLYSQTGIFVVEYALMKVWLSWGVKPSSVLGHSLGEFCAAVCAGILNVEDALKLVAKRSLLIDQLPSGKMLVIKANKEIAEELQNDFFYNNKSSKLDYAAFNADDQTVVAGCPETVLAFQDFIKNGKGIKCTLLQSTHAFHSKDMDPILEEYRKTAEKVQFKDPEVTYISGMLGKVTGEVDADYWVKHTRDPVNFLGACKALGQEQNGEENLVCVEVGPQPVLSSFMMMNSPGNYASPVCLPSLRKNTNDWKTIFTSLGKLFTSGVEISWDGVDKGYVRNKNGNLLPTYPFQRTKFWPKIPSHFRNQKRLHPMLGSRQYNPTSTVVFQSQIPSSSLQLEYLKEHRLGERIVFPGAAYMEMMLAGAAAHFYGGTESDLFPIQLKDVRILSPLELNEDYREERPTCQTILEGDEASMKASIYHQNITGEKPGEFNWIEHASASIHPQFETSLVNSFEEDEQILRDVLINFSDENKNLEVISKIKSSIEEESPMKSLYKPYSTVGFNFGERFQLLRKAWKCWDSHQFLAEIDAQKTKEIEGDKFLLHPTILDAMFQAVGFPHFDKEIANGKKPALMVPVRCKRFIWVKPLRTETCFIYSPNLDTRTGLLLDGDGGVVALIYKLDLAVTSLEGIIAALDTQQNSLAEFYEYDWEKTGSGARFDLNTALDAAAIAAEYALQPVTGLPGVVEKIKANMNRAGFLYIIKALINLGWSPQKGTELTEEEVFKSLGILQEHRRLFHHFILLLEEEGFIKMGNEQDYSQGSFRFTTNKAFPALEQVESEINEIIAQYGLIPGSPVVGDQVPAAILQLTGPILDKLLTGTSGESVLSLLFPNDTSPDTISARMFYEVFVDNGMFRFLLEKHWKNLKQQFEKTSGGGALPTIRVLEVGAGTGAGTVYLLESLEEADIPFEYFYTDISSSFFSAAEKKYAKYAKNMKFKKLNLEEDPTNQGFSPGYFDVVVAIHVVHATKDIKETLGNLRKLMVDGGHLLMGETVNKDLLLDCTFGLLDGFWRFTDFDLRQSHCMLSMEKWKKVTEETGFCKFEGLHNKEEYSPVLVCRADPNFSSVELSKTCQGKHHVKESDPKWVVLYEKGEEDYVNTLTKYFERLGSKNLVLIKASKGEALKTSKNTFIKRLDLDYSEISEALSEELEGSPTEGIIVTWGLTQLPLKECQDEVAQAYLNFLQTLIKFSGKEAEAGRFCQLPPVFLLTTGQYPSGDIVCPNPAPSTLLGMSYAVINEHKEMKLRIFDMDPTSSKEASMWKIFQEMFGCLQTNQLQPITLFRNEDKFTVKFKTMKASIPSLELPTGSSRFQLVLPPSQTIQDLKFGPLPVYKLKEKEIEVRVVCTGLNFRDVLCVLKPVQYFKDQHKVGIDYSGVITQVGSGVTKWKPGDAVFGMNPINQPLLSHVKVEEDQVGAIPAEFTFAEAASIPLIFATAHYALVELSKAKSGDWLLIHAASGGVGLAAIQIAKELGLRLICTAGSERKRAYLRSLGIQHVFNSRTLDFSRQILEVLGGNGVDLVLNSLTGEGFKEATLAACKKGAHFIEISKLNIFTEEEMTQLRPDVKYSIIDPAKFEKIVQEMKYLYKMAPWIAERKFRPIPYTRFDAGDIREALTYLQKAKHIGKVIISMPEMSNLNRSRRSPLYNNRSTYLITGGLGGIGLEVCKYMVEEGARHLVLVGRSPPTGEVTEVLEKLKQLRNCHISVLQGDVGSWEDCQKIFQHISTLAYPLRGVMHVAGTLSDGMFENLSWDAFKKTYRSKVEGSWNLHEFTKDLNLEHFVLYSSVASRLVPHGQASHISACAFEDTLAHYRNSHGLPATSINWGAWAEVGVAKNLDRNFLHPFNTRQGIQSLDKILRKNLASATVANFKKMSAKILDYFNFMKCIVDNKLKQYLSTGNVSSGGGNANKISSVSFWEEYNGGEETKGKLQVCKKYLELMLKSVLRLEADDVINEETDLSVLGMDSLMMIELLNLMQTTLGSKVTIPQALVKDCRTLKSLAIRLVEIIEEKWTEAKAPTLEQVREQSLIDVPLSKEIQVERPGSHVAPSKIKTVLLTGATGFVGSHVLKELLSFPQLERIYCLVREKDPEKRLFSVLERNRIDLVHSERVQPISGDFTKPNLGLVEETYLKKCEEIDAIFHFGARVNHGEYYRKQTAGNSNDVRTVNLGGLENVLKFACKGKTKHVFYPSTLFTTSWATGPDGRLLESWPTVERLTSCGTSMGYAISKMICELHLQQALERGVPVKLFRGCTFRASTTSGKSFAEGTHLMRMVLFGLKEGVIANEKTPLNLIPVDIAAKIMTSLAFNDQVPNEVFQLSNPRPVIGQDCIPTLAEEFGRKMTILDSDTLSDLLLKRCKEAEEEFDKVGGKSSALKKALLYDLRLIYQDKNISNFLRKWGDEAWEAGWKDHRDDFWTSKKLQKFVPEIYSQIEHPIEVLKRDVLAAIDEGLLEV